MADQSHPRAEIFISYRRSDEPYAALLLLRELQLVFGDLVFLDVEMQHGERIPERIRSALAASKLVIAVIGPRWLRERDRFGRRRIDDDHDWVRRELRFALRRRKAVLPVLVKNATQPEREALPRDLQSLCEVLNRAITVEGWNEHQREVFLARVAELTGLSRIATKAPPMSSASLEERYFAAMERKHARLLGLFARFETSEVFVEPLLSSGQRSLSETREDLRGTPTLPALVARAVRGELPGTWLVLGEPGSGKSTALRKLCVDLARAGAESAVPVFVSLPVWQRDRERTIWSHAVARAGIADGEREDTSRWLEQKHADGAVRLLLDGFDEVAPEQQSPLLDRIAPLLGAGRVTILSSRPIGKGSIVERLQPAVARVQPFDRVRQLDLLTRRLGPDRAADVAAAVHARPALARLAPNPLLLSLVAWLVERDPQAALPKRVQDLQDKIVDEILKLGWKEDETGSGSGIREWATARDILIELAYALLAREGEDSVWFESEVLDALDALCADAKALLRDCREWTGRQGFLDAVTRSGLFSEAEGKDEGYRFLHRTLGESLASRALLRRAEDDSRRGEVLALAARVAGQESRWAETYALFVGRTANPAQWLRDLKTHNGALARRAMAFVEGLDADVVGELLDLPGDDLDARCQLYLRVPELVGDRGGAVRVLGKLASTKTDAQELWFIARALDAIAEEARIAEDTTLGETVTRALGEQLFKQFPKSPGCSILEWVEVPEGTEFPMGSDPGDRDATDDERPQHPVRIARRFAIAKTPVTNAMWKQFRLDHDADAAPGGRDAPVVEVTWYDASMYCRWLGVRLPSEAEWECACRAGTTTRFSFGDDAGDLKQHGWFAGNSRGHPEIVGQKPANPWGLFDMHGNVWEWCEDAWHGSYDGAPSDGSVWTDDGSSYRVFRGGSWVGTADRCRSAYRSAWLPDVRCDDLGFRPASSSLA